MALAALASSPVLAHSAQPVPQHSIPKALTAGQKSITNWELDGSLTVVAENTLLLAAAGNSDTAGAVWATNPINYEKWTAEVEVKVIGPETPGVAGLAFWYTSKKGSSGPVHGSNDKWDGLAIMLDSVGSPDPATGAVRGHLNDGSVMYNDLDPMTQAFASCKVGYRNLNRKVHIQVSYQAGFFRIMVNGQHCFQTDHIVLPSGGYLGVSANTGVGESFFISSVELYDDIIPRVDIEIPQLKQLQEKQKQQQQQQQQAQSQQTVDSSSEDSLLRLILDKLSALETSGNSASGAQDLQKDIEALRQKQTEIYGSLDSKISSLETTVKDLILLQKQASSSLGGSASDISGDLDKLHNRLDAINNAVKDQTSSLASSLISNSVNDALTKSGPSVWLPFSLFILIQGGVLGGYWIYKKRRAGYHAKIL